MSNTTITDIMVRQGKKLVPLGRVQIPDLWNSAQALKYVDRLLGEAVLECWDTAHDLKKTLEQCADLLAACEALMEFWDNGAPVHPGAEVVNDLRAAIAKAKNQTEPAQNS